MEIENQSVNLKRKIFDNISIKMDEIIIDEEVITYNIDLKILWRLAMKLSFLKNDFVISVIPAKRI